MYPRKKSLSHKAKLLIELSKNFTEIIPRSVLEKNGLISNNGSGNRLSSQLYYTTTYYSGKIKHYNLPIDFEPPVTNNIPDTTEPRNKISGMFIYGIINNQREIISPEIRKHFKGSKCVNCGTSNGICIDHKNDLYNSMVVLSLDDFQPLCNSCNIMKRGACTWSKRNDKIFSSVNFPRMNRQVPFPWEYQNFNINCSMTQVGTYWYDPMEFHRKMRLYYQLELVNKQFFLITSKSLIWS